MSKEKGKKFLKKWKWFLDLAGNYMLGIAGGLTVLSFGGWEYHYGWLFLIIFILGLVAHGMKNLAE